MVWNGKSYLFWAIVNIKADRTQQTPPAKSDSNPPPPPKLHLEVQLAWSQYKQGKWQAKQVAPQVLVFQGNDYSSSSITLKSSFNGAVLELDVFLLANHVAAFLLGGAGNGVEAFMADTSGLSDVGPQTDGIGPLRGTKPSISLPCDSMGDGEWIAPISYSQLNNFRFT